MALDAVVVGAGIIGASIAWRLAQAGLQVILLDAGRMGAEASWAAAGMLAPGGEIETASPWAEFALESLRRYPEFVAELEDATGQSIDFTRRGAIEIAVSQAELRALQERSMRQKQLGIRACPMSPEEFRRELPMARPDVAGTFFYPDDAMVNPRDLMRALRPACLANGVEIREGVRVSAINPGRNSVEVIASDGTIIAAWAVLAAGAWSSLISIAGCALVPAFPVRGHLSGFRMAPASLAPILRHEHTYILQRADGFMIAGSSSEQRGFERELDPAIVSDIHQRTSALLPGFASAHYEESWLGFRPGIAAQGPVIAPAGETALWLAYGHYRNGILLAPATAARVASGIIG